MHKDVTKTARFWELDVLRGIAILGMVVYHWFFNLWWMGMSPVNVTVGPWRIFQTMTAALFLGLVGLGLYIKFNRASGVGAEPGVWWRILRRRVIVLGSWSAFITAVTWWLVPEMPVVFGILHCIALSSVFTVLVLMAQNWRRWSMLVVSLVVATLVSGWWIAQVETTTWWGVWLGLRPPQFASLDYFPLLPWWGVVLTGVLVGRWWYPGGERSWTLPRPRSNIVTLMSTLGQHSLLIYIVHQPLLLSILWLLQNVVE